MNNDLRVKAIRDKENKEKQRNRLMLLSPKRIDKRNERRNTLAKIR